MQNVITFPTKFKESFSMTSQTSPSNTLLEEISRNVRHLHRLLHLATVLNAGPKLAAYATDVTLAEKKYKITLPYLSSGELLARMVIMTEQAEKIILPSLKYRPGRYAKSLKKATLDLQNNINTLVKFCTENPENFGPDFSIEEYEAMKEYSKTKNLNAGDCTTTLLMAIPMLFEEWFAEKSYTYA